MRIYFNGAAQTVTGSQLYLQINGYRLLLECGLFQGKRDESYTRNRAFNFDISKLDAVVRSHAHIDHSGNLPNLVKSGYSGKIYATPAPARLTDVMLQDSGHVQEMDVQFVNQKRIRKGEPPMEPLYTQRDALLVKPLLQPVEYETPFQPIPGVTITFREAGHILGSAGLMLDIEEKERRNFRLWFSGDIGRLNLPLLRDPVLPEAADYLIMECTYGDKPHRDPNEAYREFRDVVKRTIQRGGKIIIPAFAVGRTQELVYSLNRMINEREIPPIPVFVDSPLAVQASQIFREFPQYFDEETNRFIRENRHPALMFKGLTYISSVEESKALLNERTDPIVIISASGMAEAGRIQHHLRNNIGNPRNTIVIVSWQAPNTLGRRLADHERTVKIFGESYEVRAEVVTIGGLSAHAGQDMLLRYASTSAAQLKEIFLIHGEPPASNALTALLHHQQDTPIVYPAQFSSAEI